MKILKRLLSTFLCILILLCAFVNVSAATTPKITVSDIEAMAGDTVKIDIQISDNPGIMAMAFCITYDSSALEYQNFEKGYLSSYTIQNHTDKGHVSFVNVENKDVKTNGNIITLEFAVKSDATPGKYAITLANSNRDKYGTKLHNSFSNSKQDYIVPKVVSGGVTVLESCETAGHTYSDWTVINQANCTEEGLKARECVRCGSVEEGVIPITHDFSLEWNIDKSATPQEDGIMSRHCTLCDAVTDENVFKYGDVNGDNVSSGKDCAVIIQYINGWDVAIIFGIADVTGDGKLNIKDYILMVRHINGWNI